MFRAALSDNFRAAVCLIRLERLLVASMVFCSVDVMAGSILLVDKEFISKVEGLGGHNADDRVMISPSDSLVSSWYGPAVRAAIRARRSRCSVDRGANVS